MSLVREKTLPDGATLGAFPFACANEFAAAVAGPIPSSSAAEGCVGLGEGGNRKVCANRAEVARGVVSLFGLLSDLTSPSEVARPLPVG